MRPPPVIESCPGPVIEPCLKPVIESCPKPESSQPAQAFRNNGRGLNSGGLKRTAGLNSASLNSGRYLKRVASLKLILLLAVLLLLAPLRAQWRQGEFDDTDMATDLAEALTFQKYPTYEQYLQMMQGFAGDHPEICRLDTFGTSVQGRLLLVLKISDHVEEDEPESAVLYTSTMHGNELVGYVLMLRLASYLLEGYGSDTEVTSLVDSLAIWINPLANPDGSYYPDNNHSLAGSQRFNAQGTDLNRDYPDPSAAEPDLPDGRAPENQAMMELMKTHKFTLSANIHSGAEVVNYPWDRTFDLHADDPWYRFISREYADEARAVDPEYMALFENGITNGAQWYIIKGGRQDYVNYFLEGREVTLELCNQYLLDSERLEELWNLNRRSLLNYMAQCTYGIRGRVMASGDLKPILARISIPGHDSTYSVVHSSTGHGDFYRLIKEGTYDVVVSSPGYASDTLRDVSVNDFQATWLDIRLDSLPGSISEEARPVLHLYPNPAGRYLFLELENMEYGPVDVRIFSVHGNLVDHHIQYFSGNPLKVPLQSIPGGIYLLRISDGKALLIMKFVKH